MLNHSILATPYDDYQRPYKSGGTVFVAKGVAGLWSTASDVANFVIAIQKALKGEGGSLKSDIANQMVAPVLEQNKSVATALGFDSILLDKKYYTNNVDTYFIKTGAQLGFTSVLIGSVHKGHGAVILLNSCTDHNTKPPPKAPQDNACLTIKNNS